MKKTVRGIIALLLAGGAAQAEIYYQSSTMSSSSQNWTQAFWTNATDTTPVSAVAGNAYVNDMAGGKTRANNTVFAGDSLEMRGAGSIFSLKGTPATVDLILNAGTQVANDGGGGSLYGSITTLGTGSLGFNTGADGRKTTVESQVTIGRGIASISLSCGDTDTSDGPRQAGYTLNNSANVFSGTWDIQKGYLVGGNSGSLGLSSFNVGSDGLLDFDYSYYNADSSLVIASGGILDLDQGLTFGSVTIWGITLAPGMYTASDLITTLGIDAAAFEDGLSSSGSIMVDDGSGTYSALTFGPDAVPDTFILNGKDVRQSNGGEGFYLRHFDGKDLHVIDLEYAETVGNYVTVSETQGSLPRFTFRIDTYPKHVSIHLVETEGIEPSDRQYGLRLMLYVNTPVGVKTLNDVCSGGGNYDSNKRFLKWENLWGQLNDGSRGGFALYDESLDGLALDESLASIWAHEDLPHPAGQESWTESDVLAWVDQYETTLHGISEVQIEATNLEDLYTLTDELAVSNGIKRVYLHCVTWRGEYWLYHQSHLGINTDVFPNGLEDLKAYADYLRSHGIMLKLHYLSCGIGHSDPNYILGGVDRRLDAWGTGTLERAIGASNATIYFRPDDGVELPTHAYFVNYYAYVRIEDEIIQVGRFRRTDEEVWLLEDCERGLGGTDSVSHTAGADMGGLYKSYHKNFVPGYDIGQPNSLLEEMGKDYADFINYLGLAHIHFDGIEIHRILPWCERELCDYVYSQVDHPTTSSRVGSTIAANFELEFSGLRNDLTLGYWPIAVAPRLDDPSRLPATSWLDIQFAANESIMTGGRRPGLSVAYSGQSIGMDELNHFGKIDETLELFRYYMEVGPNLHDDDLAYMQTVLWQQSGSSHYESDDVLVLEKNGDGDYVYIHKHVLLRDEDPPFAIWQEKGAVAPKQLIQSGDTITVDNPKPAQELDFIIRVDQDENSSLVNPTVTINGTESLTVTGTVDAGEYLEYEGGSTAQRFDVNWNLISNLPVSTSGFDVASGDNTISVTAGNGASVDIETQFIVTGDTYVLKTNENL